MEKVQQEDHDLATDLAKAGNAAVDGTIFGLTWLAKQSVKAALATASASMTVGKTFADSYNNQK